MINRVSQLFKPFLKCRGKLFDDFHASRVLPGFQPDSKLQMLMQLKEQAEIVIVISAQDIEKKTGSHFTAARTRCCNNNKRTACLYVIITSVTIITNNM